MSSSKIRPEIDGFHHLVFVGIKCTDTDTLRTIIAQLQAGIAAIVDSDARVQTCAFFGNHARFEDDLHFGFHAVFADEAALDAVRQHPDHLALMQWFATVSNGKRTEINAIVSNGVNTGATRAPNRGLLSPL